MKIGVLCPRGVPAVRGGAERLWDGLVTATNELTPHRAELVEVEAPERTLADVVHSYARFADLDVGSYDLLISGKYPAWMARHPQHVVYLCHPLRGLYDAYPGPPAEFKPATPSAARALDLVDRLEPGRPGGRDRVLEAALELVETSPPSHPDVSFPGPLARLLVHWLDRDAMSPRRIRRFLTISATVAARRDYVPPNLRAEVVIPPSGLALPTPGPPGDGFFLASRLDAPKRIDLAIEAMRSIDREDITLRIAGSGPQHNRLAELAAGDRRITLLGEIPDRQLAAEYASCRAVVFIPQDEDLGLVVNEAQRSGRAVITCRDSGGPLELVHDGVNGIVVAPDAAGIADAMLRLHDDVNLATRLGDAGVRTSTTATWERTVESLLSPPSAPRRRVAKPVRANVIALSSYPVFPPSMGGQVRTSRLLAALADDVDVEVLCVGEANSSTDVGPHLRQRVFAPSNALVEQDWAWRSQVGAPTGDIAAALLRDELGGLPSAIWHATRSADLGILCHPYLGTLLPRGIPAVYDAHNVETDLKRELYRPGPVGDALARAVFEVESMVLRRATLVTSVSDHDAASLASMAPSLARYEVVENGFDPFPDSAHDASARASGRDRYLALARQLGVAAECSRMVMFTGSAHPPNIVAAHRVLESAQYLPHVLFVLLGGHGDHLPTRSLPTNVLVRGQVATDELRRVLCSCDVALNPVVGGSGTNIKMIEYAAAGAPIVSTLTGARGLPLSAGLHYTPAEPERLHDSIRQALDRPDIASARAERARRAVEAMAWPRVADRFRRHVLAELETAAARR